MAEVSMQASKARKEEIVILNYDNYELLTTFMA